MVTPLATPEVDGLSSVGGTAAPMITKVEIENYKSIRKLTLELGRMNVFIGENGCGKTNILEAITLGSAASRGKLDNEYLVPRGIRVTKPELMRSAFAARDELIQLKFVDADQRAARFRLMHVSESGVWLNLNPGGHLDAEISSALRRVSIVVDGRPMPEAVVPSEAGLFFGAMEHLGRGQDLKDILGPGTEVSDCLIFGIENSALRRRDYEGPLFPFSVKGEGLLAHLQQLASESDAPAIATINEHLALLDWFEHLHVPSREMAEQGLRIRDRYLAEGVVFDQKSANEGFLFLLFYLTLFISPHTPRFFAIDNVDASLNPKLCQALMASMVTLAKQHDKQAIVTTHNPSLLDGLDLHDDDQRLFVVSRGLDGETRIRRVSPPKPLPGDEPVRLSEAFLNGYIGGLPKNF